jgi:Glycosyl hydrolase family 12
MRTSASSTDASSTSLAGEAQTAKRHTLKCPAHGSTSARGCGSWNAGRSSGNAPGFAKGQRSHPNLLSVNQDPWTGGQGPQTITAYTFQRWSVTATDTDPSNAPGEVLTYPDASFNYYQLDTAASGYKAPPSKYDLNNITSLTSVFTESMPRLKKLNAEAAYDLWLNNWQTEIMVWVDTSPAKDRNLADDGMTKVGTYTYSGQKFALWRSGKGIKGFYVFLLNHNETSGSVNLKAMLATMVSLKYIPATSPLTQIPFGWEISDTGGKPVTLSMSRFRVSLRN